MLLPDLVNLPFNTNQLPPELNKEIRTGKLDLRKVAVSLIERKRQFQNRWKTTEAAPEAPAGFPNSCDEVEVISFFPEQHIEGLIKNGQLNMFQTGESRGLTQKTVRAKAENTLIGISIDDENDGLNSKLHYLRPKYGLLNFSSPCGVHMNPNRLLIYGQVIIVYNDDVKIRTMYNYGDSLFSYCQYIGGNSKTLEEPHSLVDFSPPDKPENYNVRYVEAQIWGPIDLSDIKEFRIPDERKDLLERLKPAGKPIYSYSRENMINCDLYMEISEIGLSRGNLLYSPTK